MNYPDLLGAITNRQRLTVDLVQCAISTRPDQVVVGRNFEVLFLMQNTTDTDIDVTVEMQLPQRDAQKQKNVFSTKSSRLLVGLQPAEVGYILLPAACSPKTAPGEGYEINATVKAEKTDRKAPHQTIRAPEGGGKFNFQLLPDETKKQLMELRQLSWEVKTHNRRNSIAATFDVVYRGIGNLTQPKVGWNSLWTLKDHLDQYALANRMASEMADFTAQLNPEAIFKPLLMATQQAFHKGGYPLKIGEAVYITKIMTHVLCHVPVPPPTPENARPYWHTWYGEAVQMLFMDPRLKDYAPKVVVEKLYFQLLFDAVVHGFEMVITVLNEDFGDPDERAGYARDIIGDVQHGGLSFAQVYLPLIVAGIIVNNRVVMPRENVRETLHAISQARDSRLPERNPDNEFIFQMVENLVDRELSIDSF